RSSSGTPARAAIWAGVSSGWTTYHEPRGLSGCKGGGGRLSAQPASTDSRTARLGPRDVGADAISPDEVDVAAAGVLDDVVLRAVAPHAGEHLGVEPAHGNHQPPALRKLIEQQRRDARRPR